MTEQKIVKCTRCHMKFYENEFVINRLGQKHKTCTKCQQERIIKSKKYYETHKHQIQQYKKHFYQENKINLIQKQHDNYQKNKMHIIQHKHQYNILHKEQIKKHQQFYIKSSLNIIINHKIKNYKKEDMKKNRLIDENYITINWVKDQLIKCNNHCYYCNKLLKLTGYEYKDSNQFSIDRIDNTIAHTQINCVISCWQCNKYKNKLSHDDFLKKITNDNLNQIKKIDEKYKQLCQSFNF